MKLICEVTEDLETLVEEKGDGVDYERLGYLYEIGDGVHKDTSIAAKYYKIAMEKGDLFAKQSLAKLYFWGDGVDQDYDKSFKLFKN